MKKSLRALPIIKQPSSGKDPPQNPYFQITSEMIISQHYL